MSKDEAETLIHASNVHVHHIRRFSSFLFLFVLKKHFYLQVFIGPSSSVARRKQMLSYPIRAFAIKITPTDGHINKCLRMEFYGYGMRTTTKPLQYS